MASFAPNPDSQRAEAPGPTGGCSSSERVIPAADRLGLTRRVRTNVI